MRRVRLNSVAAILFLTFLSSDSAAAGKAREVSSPAVLVLYYHADW